MYKIRENVHQDLAFYEHWKSSTQVHIILTYKRNRPLCLNKMLMYLNFIIFQTQFAMKFAIIQKLCPPHLVGLNDQLKGWSNIWAQIPIELKPFFNCQLLCLMLVLMIKWRRAFLIQISEKFNNITFPINKSVLILSRNVLF